MDNFFLKENCDRCGAPLLSRIMSWFTRETICQECSKKESVIRRKLKEQGKPDMENCGYIPKV